MEGKQKEVEATIAKINVLSIESGQQAEKSQEENKYGTASAHAVDRGQY